MSDEKALLAAIWKHPHEDAPRLVYADWLQENGQPERAEFIRVQCELARLGQWDESPRKAELAKRERALWKKYGKAWRAGLPSPLKVGLFRRGFPDPPQQSVTGKQFLKFAESKLRAAPLWSFGLGATTDQEMAQIPDSPVLSQTEALSGWQTIPALTGSAVARLVSSPRARNLRTLYLSRQRLGDAGADGFGRSANLPNLVALYLMEAELTDEGMRCLCQWPGMKRLRDLGLPGNALGDTALDALAAVPFERGLKTLLIGGNPGFTTAGLIRLIESPAAASLGVLHVVGSPAVTAEFAEALASSPRSRSLRTLTLSNTNLGDRGVAAILDSPHLQELNFLNVMGSGFRSAKVRKQLGEQFGGGGFGNGFGGFRTRRPDRSGTVTSPRR
jgi:uncharacterized protein (TIGR02996 family)